MGDNLGEVLLPRVPKDRWPIATSDETLEQCGTTGRLARFEFPGQEFPWGLYEQSGHAGSALVVATTPEGRMVALVHQWRPCDTESVELPAGNIGGSTPQKMIDGFLQELREEVGDLHVVSVETCKGFAHDVGREAAAGGGPKCFFPFVIKVLAPTAPKTYSGEDGEETSCRWYREEDVRTMVHSGRIADMVTCFFLLAGGVISTEDFLWRNITASFQ